MPRGQHSISMPQAPGEIARSRTTADKPHRVAEAVALFEDTVRRHRTPNTIDELYQWLVTPEGRAAYQRSGRTP